jgi:hypothetical protein
MNQYQGTVKPFPGFNGEEDAKVLRKAMKGLGMFRSLQVVHF